MFQAEGTVGADAGSGRGSWRECVRGRRRRRRKVDQAVLQGFVGHHVGGFPAGGLHDLQVGCCVEWLVINNSY